MCIDKANTNDIVQPAKDYAAITAKMVDQGIAVTQSEVEETLKNCKGNCATPCWAKKFSENLKT